MEPSGALSLSQLSREHLLALGATWTGGTTFDRSAVLSRRFRFSRVQRRSTLVPRIRRRERSGGREHALRTTYNRLQYTANYLERSQ